MKLKKQVRKIKILIFENFSLKLLSFIVSFLLWLNVSSQTQSKFQIYSYVDVIDIPQDLDVKKIKPEKVKVILEGSYSNKLDDIKVKTFVKGDKLKEGKNELPVEVVINSSKYKVVSIQPESVIIYTYKNSTQNKESQ
ncbi:hypothetical protein [Sulfurihydrogenibium azorense]|uniref:hypothetical protein n=1 Tax=Sulfurihydrogenibium azorense TaxID=309806 RepID=UPI0024090E19|nr:hypothetical protein [Sulfurihydrogenibium azorense]MDM7273377.1 hypothetical protein [Sulfurihydrogenibium azorense]